MFFSQHCFFTFFKKKKRIFFFFLFLSVTVVGRCPFFSFPNLWKEDAGGKEPRKRPFGFLFLLLLLQPPPYRVRGLSCVSLKQKSREWDFLLFSVFVFSPPLALYSRLKWTFLKSEMEQKWG